MYTWCTLFVSIGGFMFGFDTGSIGPITVMPQFKDRFDPISPTLQGLIVSSILIPAALASLVAGPLSDRISRTRTIAIGGAVFSIGSVLACAASDLAMLFVGRCIAGVGEGLFLSVVTVYICEIAPSNLRGTLCCTLQLLITIGIAAGYFVTYGTVRASASFSWRFPFGMQAVAGIILAAGSIFLPHSPRWLKHVGRDAEVDVAWARLGLTAAEAEKESETVQRTEEQESRRQQDWRSIAKQLWHRDVRMRTFLGCFLMAMQQASGIDGVLYYAPVLFSQAGLSSTKAAFLASGVSGLLNIACTIVTQIYTEKWGRRPSVIRGGLVLSGTMLIIGSLYASRASDTPAGRWTIIALIYVFVAAFSMSWAVTNRVYCSEIQPMHTRAAATSLGQCANWVINWVIAFSTPLFLARSSYGAYFLFGACSLLTVLVCLAFQPESKGVSLEALDQIFEVSPWRKMLARRLARHARLQSHRHEEIALGQL
ncbi:hypothetical protein PLICRDRAFT_109396 [Plicaturopsis crispa FD-325 SS-3]|nr:hypothetical protein PLICRDRAFT_109396 [Plicaturopsis crispa FD-325 SS-3]